jgi:Domain of unknown function (DUF4282)
MSQTKGFFASLLDLSFSSLITGKIIKVLYVMSLVVGAVAALTYIVLAFTQSTAFGILMLLVLAPLATLLYVVYSRVVLEVVIVLFRILETNQQIAANTTAARGTFAASPPPQPPTDPAPTPATAA